MIKIYYTTATQELRDWQYQILSVRIQHLEEQPESTPQTDLKESKEN